MPAPRPIARRPGARPVVAGRPAPEGLHPRNRHQGRYDLPRLIRAHPALAGFVARNAYGDDSIDFADPRAVTALNAALLGDWYGIAAWDQGGDFLCPPIPGRADYLHHAADLLAGDAGGTIPRGRAVRVLDIGMGAYAVYPLIGHAEYGWRFVGSEVDPEALTVVRRILAKNLRFAAAIEIRRQTSPLQVFAGVVRPEERFDLTVCNPPFHASAAEARAGSQRKWRNLGKAPVLNFGGQAGELWCPGGEVAFIGRMIAESVAMTSRCCWFTTLVAKEAHLSTIEGLARQAKVGDVRTLPMGQGQKRSRIVAWTFLTAAQRRSWRRSH